MFYDHMFYDHLDSPIGRILLAGNGDALTFIGLPESRHPFAIPPEWRREASAFETVMRTRGLASRSAMTMRRSAEAVPMRARAFTAWRRTFGSLLSSCRTRNGSIPAASSASSASIAHTCSAVVHESKIAVSFDGVGARASFLGRGEVKHWYPWHGIQGRDMRRRASPFLGRGVPAPH